jgi:hypothetical protein
VLRFNAEVAQMIEQLGAAWHVVTIDDQSSATPGMNPQEVDSAEFLGGLRSYTLHGKDWHIVIEYLEFQSQ